MKCVFVFVAGWPCHTVQNLNLVSPSQTDKCICVFVFVFVCLCLYFCVCIYIGVFVFVFVWQVDYVTMFRFSISVHQSDR